MVSAIPYTSGSQLGPSIQSHKIWCQDRALLLPVPHSGEVLASKLNHYFSSHPAAFGSCPSLPPNNITLNPANKRTDQSFSDFWTGIGAPAHVTLDCKQFISHSRTAYGNKIASLQCSDGGVIATSEVHELLTNTHDILDSTVSKQVGNLAHFLAYLFNSPSRQHCEVWASQFSFLHSNKDSVPPREACLYSHMNWSLAQTQQQSFIALSQSSTSMRDARAKPKAGF